MVRWQGGKGGRVMRWQGGRVVKREGGKYLVLFKGGGRRESPRFHLFVLMLINGAKGQDGFKIFLHDCRHGKTLLRSSTSCEKYSSMWECVEFVICNCMVI